jgi:hypothetical protein
MAAIQFGKLRTLNERALLRKQKFSKKKSYCRRRDLKNFPLRKALSLILENKTASKIMLPTPRLEYFSFLPKNVLPKSFLQNFYL